MHPDLGEYIYSMPPQQIMVSRWYRGTADSIYQNLNLLEAERPQHVLILSGDHVYKMNYREMLDFHLSRGADLTVAAVRCPGRRPAPSASSRWTRPGQVENFLEKPADPPGHARQSRYSLVSMGVYIFNAGTLVEEVIKDAKNKTSKHDFGGDIIPQMVGRKKVFAFNFAGPGQRHAPLLAGYRHVGRLFQGPSGPVGPHARLRVIRSASGPCAPGRNSCPPANSLPGGCR